MEDSFFNFQWSVNSIDDQLSSVVAFGDNTNHLNAHPPLFEYNETVMEPSSRPSKQLKSHNSDHSLMNRNHIHGSSYEATNQSTIVKPKDESIVSSKGTIGFNCNNLPSSNSSNENYYVFNKGCQGSNGGGGSKVTTTRITPYQDHVLAERKRREKLSQQFIALSALLPNLKRMDKASVLGDAIEHTKILQEKVKNLEEQARKIANKKLVRIEAVVDGGEISSSHEKISGVPEKFPEIEARFSGKNVLIRVHCEKKSGVVENTLAEIEKLHVSVISSTSMIFADSAIHITVIAQMDKDLTMTMEDFVKNLRFGLEKFM
ncbi:hypothetical protein L1887_04375 [Cichorium endivia]|nr:hypothetical protein L1887_04375 [Cichorium endivia]